MTKGRILVVEDENIVAMGIEKMLKSLGYTITEVISSKENIMFKVKNTVPDLVLMDVMLKDELDGIDAAEEIITRFSIPVIYLTTFSKNKNLKRIWESEHFGFIVKPFDERDLKRCIDFVFSRFRKEKECENWIV